ncbi:MAG: hypothetical protein JRI36_08365 [Deltaproteobacteria bacterium]|nr:hypothetical protein [Deltaproteobacteria bacterium]
MQRHGTYIMLLAVVAYLLVCPNIGQARTDRQQGKEHGTVSDSCADITKRDQSLKDTQDNAATLFRIGVCFLKKGHPAEAHRYLARAASVDGKFAELAARAYMTAGNRKLHDGRIRDSRIFFQKAIRFDPGLKIQIAREAFEQGQWLFNRGLYQDADERFAVANELDDSYRDRICEMYFALGNALDSKRCIEPYRLAGWYCSDHNEEIGLRLLGIAKRFKSKEWQDVYKAEAAKYVSDETIRAAFPNPSWRTVYASAYMGKGYDQNNSPEYHIRTLRFGKDVLDGDKIIVEVQGNFRIWDAGWDEYQSRCEIISKNKAPGQYLYVEAPEGERIMVSVQRYQ